VLGSRNAAQVDGICGSLGLNEVSMTKNLLTRAFRSFVMATGLCIVAGGVFTSTDAIGQGTFEGPTIDYLNAEVDDAVVQLMARIESGETKLVYEKEHGYLKSLLSELEIPIDSQTLVFSKTSLQLQRITPRRPRALYFNDDVYVGYCQNGDVVEIAATDAKQGATFYTLEQDVDEAPSFIRDRGQCLTCHASSRTQNVPGYLVRSVFANKMGHPILGSGTYTTDHQSPFEERWGGWYVTGEHGKMQHMGNKLFNDKDHQHDLSAGLNLTSLDGLVSTAPYLSPHSDIVALMVLEHQTQVHNAMIAANYETREALHQCFEMNQFLEREPGFISDSANRRIDAVAENLVEHLLMCDEFVLQDKVQGTSGFAETFEQRGPRDSQGRSLRELELLSRLFRYRCSFLIHSPSFDGLPDEVRQRVVKRMLDILEGRDASPKFAHLATEEKQAILQILRETKPEFRG
jgi:hypothetical protein